MLLNPRSQYPRRCPDRLLFTTSGSSYLLWHHPPCSSGNLATLVLQTGHGNFHPTAPGRQSAPAVLSASGVLSVSAFGATVHNIAMLAGIPNLPCHQEQHNFMNLLHNQSPLSARRSCGASDSALFSVLAAVLLIRIIRSGIQAQRICWCRLSRLGRLKSVRGRCVSTSLRAAAALDDATNAPVFARQADTVCLSERGTLKLRWPATGSNSTGSPTLE